MSVEQRILMFDTFERLRVSTKSLGGKGKRNLMYNIMVFAVVYQAVVHAAFMYKQPWPRFTGSYRASPILCRIFGAGLC